MTAFIEEVRTGQKISRSFCLSISVKGSSRHLDVQSKTLEVILASFFPHPRNPNSRPLLRLLPPEYIWMLHTRTISAAVSLGQAAIIPLKCFHSLLTGLALSTLGPASNPLSIKQTAWWCHHCNVNSPEVSHWAKNEDFVPHRGCRTPVGHGPATQVSSPSFSP